MGEPFTAVIYFRDGTTERHRSDDVEHRNLDGIRVRKDDSTRDIAWGDIVLVEINGSDGEPKVRWPPPSR